MRAGRVSVFAATVVVALATVGGVAVAADGPEAAALSGVVTDTLTGAPVPGVNVHLHRVEPEVGPSGPMTTATTDGDGRYSFDEPGWLEQATHIGIHQGVPGYEQLWRFINWDGQTVPYELDLDLFPTSDGAKVLVQVVDAITGDPLGRVDAFLHAVEPDGSPIPFLPFSGAGDEVAYYRVDAGRDLYVQAHAPGYLTGISEVVRYDGVAPVEVVVALQPRSVDVPEDATHAPGIDWLLTSGYATGYADGTFRPGEPITRAQMATLLTNVLDLPAGDASFVDVRAGATHEHAIAAVVGAGIAQGYADGTFRPGAPVLRAHLATFLANALDLDPVDPDFLDVEVGAAHAGAIGAVVAGGYAQGYDDGTFRPTVPVTRGQLATLLMNTVGE